MLTKYKFGIERIFVLIVGMVAGCVAWLLFKAGGIIFEAYRLQIGPLKLFGCGIAVAIMFASVAAIREMLEWTIQALRRIRAREAQRRTR